MADTQEPIASSTHNKPQHVPPSICCMLATAALLPAAPEAAAEAEVEVEVAETATGGEAMVVEIMAEIEGAVWAYNNQP
jgi:hypothetical protein